MKLSDIRARVSELREQRAGIHEQLSACLADYAQTAGEARSTEKALRDQVRAINLECYPLEVAAGKAGKIARGAELTEDERALYEQCCKEIGGVELG